MKRWVVALGLASGVAVGTSAGGCLWGGCPDSHEPVELTDARYVGSLSSYADPMLGAYAVPEEQPVEVEVDTARARVIVRFESEGRAVEQVYAITRTEQSWF